MTFVGKYFFVSNKGYPLKKIINDNLEIEACIISSINLEALILLPRSKVRKIILDVRDIWPDAHRLSIKTFPFYIYCHLSILYY